MFRGNGNIENLAIDHVLSICVRKLSRGFDYCAAEPLLGNLRFPGHCENDGERKAILSEVETAEFLAECGWEHRDGSLNEVDTGGPLLGITVERSIGFYEVGDISDMNTDVVGTIVVGFDGQCVIQILGEGGVDCEGTLLPQVSPNLELALRNTKRMRLEKANTRRRLYLHPRGGWEALEHVLTKVLGWEVAVLEQCAGLNFNITNGT